MKRYVLVVGVAALGIMSAPTKGEPYPPVSSQFITVEENRLLIGGLPRPPQLEAISEARADAFFAALRAEKVEYRYVVGSCEDRAHFIAMMARKAGIPVGKVWAIAPKRYTLLNRSLLEVRDPSGVTNGVTWGHHVAPVVRVMRDGEPRTLVIDQTFSPEEYMTLDAWSGSLGNSRALFFFSGVDDYLFNSLDGLNVWKNPQTPGEANESLQLPKWMPNLLTGDFMYYTPSNHDGYITGGLAQDQLAMHIFTGGVTAASPDERQRLLQAIRTEDGLAQLADGTYSGLAPTTREAITGYYSARKLHWENRLRSLQ
jgi:hypothetical protein